MIQNNFSIKTENDKARKNFINAGLAYSDISSKDFYKLVEILKEELSKYTDRDGETLPMTVSAKPKRNAVQFNMDSTGCLQSAFIKVDSFYFDGREGISFNSDGWIGFAGWASSNNTMPFVNAFNKWVELLKKGQ